MTALPTVTIVMPCYNGSAYIREALDSAVAQTHKAMEIIIVDDGSKDDSAQVVRDYAAAHPEANIELIQQPNAGEPSARNTGIRAAKGEWVAQLDTDDWWEPTKLELQLKAAAAQGADCVLVHTGVTHHFPDGRSEDKPLEGPSRRVGRCAAALLEPTSIGHPSIMVRRDALHRIDGYDASFLQACDIDLYFRLSAIGSFAFVPQHLLHYRMHAGQMSASQVKQIRFHHRAVRKFCEQHPAIAQQIGQATIEAALAEHVAVKLESLYWKRRLPEFRELLAYADEAKLRSPSLDAWRSRARWPDWAIRLKDKLAGR
jgi:glycosyltransferase involved in cell wall biosynthesis